MPFLKTHAKTIAAAFFLGCIVNLFGRGYYTTSYRAVVEEHSIASGQFVCFYTVPGGWPWFGFNLAVTAYGMIAWRYFGGWITAPLVLALCVSGPLMIEKIEEQRELDRLSASGIEFSSYDMPTWNEHFALHGGLLGGAVAIPGLALLNLGVERRRWTSQHLFLAMAVAACLFGGLKLYDWQRQRENREFFVQSGAWPRGWQVTDEDRRLHEEWVRQIEERWQASK